MGLSASQRATRNGLRTAFTSDRATVTRPRNLEVFQSWSNKYSYLPDHISLLYAQAHASAVDLSLCLSACGKSPCIPTTTYAAAATILLFFILLVVQTRSLPWLPPWPTHPRVHLPRNLSNRIWRGVPEFFLPLVGSSRRRSIPTTAAG